MRNRISLLTTSSILTACALLAGCGNTAVDPAVETEQHAIKTAQDKA